MPYLRHSLTDRSCAKCHNRSIAITLIPGDGTGPEITEATRRVLEATGVKIDWEVQWPAST